MVVQQFFDDNNIMGNGVILDSPRADDIQVTISEFKRECLQALEDKGKLNTITTVMVNNIVSLYKTALECKESIDKDGVMIEYIDGKGNPQVKRNDAVTMQEKNISSMAKLLAQLELDNIVAKVESAF